MRVVCRGPLVRIATVEAVAAEGQLVQQEGPQDQPVRQPAVRPAAAVVRRVGRRGEETGGEN